jgi:restriction system protein
MKFQLTISAWVFLIAVVLLVIYALSSASSGIRYRFQNRGEAAVSDYLLTSLPLDRWHLLNNITLKVDDHTTQIDHILVSTFGIFVIETKHYSGWIFGDANSKTWTQVKYNLKFRFQNPLRQNFKHLKAVQELLDFVPPEHIKGLVVFSGSAIFKTKSPAGVYTIGSMVDYLKGLTQEVLTENRMQFCVGRLECKRLALTQTTDVEHRQNLAARKR